MALFYSGPIIYKSWYKQYKDPETEAAKRGSAIVHLIIYTLATVASQHVFSNLLPIQLTPLLIMTCILSKRSLSFHQPHPFKTLHSGAVNTLSVLLHNVNTLFWTPLKANKGSMNVCVCVYVCKKHGGRREGTMRENTTIKGLWDLWPRPSLFILSLFTSPPQPIFLLHVMV